MTTLVNKNIPSDVELSDAYWQRFSGIARLYGEASLKTFSKSNVAIIGIGGVGSWTAEALARSGVQNITLIDLDEVCVTNTNRQLHALENTVGATKVKVTKERLEQINPEGIFLAVEDFLTEETLERLLSPKFDIIVDAIDSLKNKVLLAVYCRQFNIPLVTVGGAGGKKDPTLIRRGDLSESTQDNLLKRMKKKLRVDFDFPRLGPMNITCVYSLERAVYPTEEGLTCFKKDLLDKSQAKLDCATGMGTATFGTGGFGFTAAHCALELLTQKR
ncbi:MAG: tRNA threonylcarbamoyladenosine dehydratase [Bacteriovoracaceae bacterium]|nr:tRNA threonylcarbamoyladenosine dehydratase [Bacteriovoracaceae bacterium]